MAAPLPPVDGRTAADLVAQTEQLAQQFSGWAPPPAGADFGRGLITVFADMAAQVVARLNRVPERDQLAFFDLLGLAPLPAQAARAPLTFTLADGQDVALVPAGTEVAPGASAGVEGVLFETEREVTLVAAPIVAVVAHEPAADRSADVTAVATTGAGAPFPAFSGDTLIDHFLYVAHDEFATLPSPRRLAVTLDFTDAAGRDAFGRLGVEWARWDGAGWAAVAGAGPGAGAPAGATGWSVALGDVPAPEPVAVEGRTARWFRARTTRALQLAGGVPAVAAVTVAATADQAAAPPPDKAFTDAAPVDLSRDVYPFGEFPRFNQAFVARTDILGRAGARLVADVALTNPPPVAVNTTGGATVAWEVGGADGWVEVGRSTPSSTGPDQSPFAFQDATKALTTSGTVSFVVPAVGGPLAVNGETGWWLRARLVGGNYGGPATFRVQGTTTVPVPATYGPPSVHHIGLSWSFDRSEAARAIVTMNDGVAADVTAVRPFVPYAPSADSATALYLGFDRPLPNRPMALFWTVGATSGAPPPGGTALVWEYSQTGGAWARVDVVDETEGLTREGLVSFVVPADLAAARHLGQERWWLRVLAPAASPAAPLVRRLLTNTTWASHAHVTTDEVLGWASGLPGQAFSAANVPVLEGERLDVAAAAGGRRVVWAGVPNFAASGPLDRHYVLDRSTGQVTFGDGHHGLVPAGGSIVRLSYRSGGGGAGNLAAGTITELRAAVAGVAAVTNLEPSGGGSDAEPLERVRDRGPRALRHGGRAVAAGDYEDLAAEASAQVARARCRPPGVNPLDVAWIDPVPVAPPGPEAASVLCHADDATAAARAAADPAGRVGVTVVPGLDTTQPTPSQGLLDEVRAALLAAGPAVLPAGRLDVAGPDWVEVAVHATVAATSLATAVTAPTAVIEALERFLHPLHGGSDGGGWPFGRLPHPSDLIAVVAAVPGVDHVRSLDVTTVPDPATLSAEQLRTTLVASGAHSVVVAGIGEAS